MKKFELLLCCIVCVIQSALAQRDTSLTTEHTRTYYVLDMSNCNQNIREFISKEGVILLKLNEKSDQIVYDLMLDPKQYNHFLGEAGQWGNFSTENISSKNYFDEIETIELELNFTKKRMQNFQELINKLDPKDLNYLELWREVRRMEENVNTNEIKLATLKKSNRRYKLHLVVIEEKNPTEDDYFSLVNMPGLEYSYIKIENPKKGLSADHYQGLFLKYMFTRGKSYGLLGAIKNTSTLADSTANELFVFALGQDFYSRFFGRGMRKSLNLYSSFNLGYLMGTSEKSKFNSWYMSAFIGVEILKTKYLLLDNKIGYTVPFSDNRNFRGLDYRVSFNFVF